MKTKITALLIILAICSTNTFGQKKSTHEFGIQLGSLQGFSLIYKKEIDKNELVRLQIGRGYYNRTMFKDDEPIKRSALNFSYGKEKEKC